MSHVALGRRTGEKEEEEAEISTRLSPLSQSRDQAR